MRAEEGSAEVEPVPVLVPVGVEEERELEERGRVERARVEVVERGSQENG